MSELFTVTVTVTSAWWARRSTRVKACIGLHAHFHRTPMLTPQDVAFGG